MKHPVLFDLNGTMIFDSDKHQSAWISCFHDLFGLTLTEDDFNRNVNGKTNEKIIDYAVSLTGRPVGAAERRAIAREKEDRYCEACLADPAFGLAPGLCDYLDYLKTEEIPRIIVTSSDRVNVDFYFRPDVLDLGRWFSPDGIVYDTFTLPSKPDPAFFLEALKRLGADGTDCLGFEDSISGIAAAQAAGIGRVVAVASAHQPGYLDGVTGLCAVIDDFTDFRSFDFFKS